MDCTKIKDNSGRKDIEYDHSWILFISQLNSKEETPLRAQIPFPSRGRRRNPHLPTPSLPKAGLAGTTAGDLEPKCFQLSARGLGTPDHIQESHTQSCSPGLFNIILKTSPHSHIISAGWSLAGSWCLAFHSSHI